MTPAPTSLPSPDRSVAMDGTRNEIDATPGSNDGEEKLDFASTPLKAAAKLIQTLDLAYSEMTHSAADAAKEAEIARRNARAASEIARRYLHRSYPKAAESNLFTFGGTAESFPATPVSPPRLHQRIAIAASSTRRGPRPAPLPPLQSAPLSQPTSEDKCKLPLSSMGEIQDDLLPSQEETNERFFASSPSRPPRRSKSTDRIVEKHAEDLLAISLELEHAKQARLSEQRLHEETKQILAAERQRSTSLEEENRRLKQQLDAQKTLLEKESSSTFEELQKSQLRLQAAEEDAELALDLAKDSAEKREEMEERLNQALEELSLLKQSHPSQGAPVSDTPKRSVRFADDVWDSLPPATPHPNNVFLEEEEKTPKSSASRSMIAAGRQLLRRSKATSEDDRDQVIMTLELTPAKSAERRKRLLHRLLQLEYDNAADTPYAASPMTPITGSSTPPPPPPPPPPSSATTALVATPKIQPISPGRDDVPAAIRLMQESGQRLELGGHWWRDPYGSGAIVPYYKPAAAGSTPGPNAHRPHRSPPIEAVTKQYTQSVETKIGQQEKEIQELESLCGFLEQKLVNGTNPAKTHPTIAA